MKYILPILFLACLYIQCGVTNKTTSQMTTETGELDLIWTTIDSLEKEGLYASALKELNVLLNNAREQQAKNHVVKALFYQAKYHITLQEDSAETAIMAFEKELSNESDYSYQRIYHSILGQLYSQYAQQNQFKIRNRSNGATSEEGIAEMNLAQLIGKSNQHIHESVKTLHDENLDLRNYQMIIDSQHAKYKDVDLYSVLLMRALHHFKNDLNLLTEPSYASSIYDPQAFGDLQTFLNATFKDGGEVQSFRTNSLQLYQKLLNYLKDDELIDQLNVERLTYVYQIHKAADKRELYRQSLLGLIEKTDYAKFALAQLDYNANEKSREAKAKNVNANRILNEIINQNIDQQLTNKSKQLLQSIEQPLLNIATEKVIVPKLPTLFKIDFKNLDDISFSIREISLKEMEDFSQLRNQDQQLTFIKSLEEHSSWTQNLPKSDFTNISSELVLEGLALGQYIILAESEGLASFNQIYVSNLSYAATSSQSGIQYIITDRYSGKPLTGIKADLYERNYQRGKQNETIIATLYSDEAGLITYKHNAKRGINVRLQHQNDVLDLRQAVNPSYHRNQNRQNTIHTFLDRNIYRPGHRVYVKAIILQSDKNGRQPVSTVKNDKLTLIVRDVNRKEIFNIQTLSNEYGSISTDFQLPAVGLGGQYSIEISSESGARNYTNLRVEAYKRPTFYSELIIPDVAYQLGDSITITGKSAMFSGSPLDNASVQYRITRNQMRYFDWNRYSSRGGHSGESAEIKNGTVQTDALGKFKIPFILKESAKNQHDEHAVYSFRIDITTTDVSGETHSTTKQLRVSKKDVFISSNINHKTDIQSSDTIIISSKNINGGSITYKGTLKIHELLSPQSYKKSKYWNDLDTAILTQADYDQLPHSYKLNEADPLKWNVGNEIYSTDFTTEGEHTMTWPTEIKPGYYKLEILNAEGEVDYMTVTNIFDFRKAGFDVTKIFEFKLNKDSYAVNETASLSVGSAHEDVRVFYQLEKDGAIVDYQWLILNGKTETITIPIQEADKGGFIIHTTSFYKGRIQQEQVAVNVPYVDKKLKINIESFRSTLEPGSEEEWTLTIVDQNNQAVTAEILASLYDASLDALSHAHKWQQFTYRDYQSIVHRIIPGYQLQYFRFLKYRQSQHYDSSGPTHLYPDLNFFGYTLTGLRAHGEVFAAGGRVMKSRSRSTTPSAAPEMSMDAAMESTSTMSAQNTSVDDETTSDPLPEFDWSTIRDVLDETVFFYPELISNTDGKSILKFKMSDALSSWKLQVFVHDTDARYGYQLLELKTKKDLSIYPNVSRFLRVGDELTLSGKLVNSSDSNSKTSATIQFINPDTNEDVTDQVLKSESTIHQYVNANSSQKVTWSVHVDESMLSGLIYRMRVGNEFGSDAIEGFLPVTSRRVLITESLPLYVGANQSKLYHFNSLDKVNASSTAAIDRYTVEYTSNPSWYVMQALPYLSTPEVKSASQLLNQYASHVIARSITEEMPQLKSMLQNWERKSTGSKDSPLNRNQELKISRLEQTPWLRQSMSEEEQRSQLLKFYKANESDAIIGHSLEQLLTFQNSDGGFSWLPGRKSSDFITANILQTIGRLNMRKIRHDIPDQVISNAVTFLDAAIQEIAKTSTDKKRVYYNPLQLLYARSFFVNEYPMPSEFEELSNKLIKDWQKNPLYQQAQIALISNRIGDQISAGKIVESLHQQMISTEDQGAYWKLNRDYYSNHSSIDKQVLMIELFHELKRKQEDIDQLRIWLLRNKQTNHWKSNQSTASAVHAFLMNHKGAQSDWLNNATMAEISIGGQALKTSPATSSLYIKEEIDQSSLSKQSAEISIKNANDQAGWGAAYVQYYEDIDVVETNQLNELTIRKEIYKQVTTDEGPQLQSLETTVVVPGDKLVVRLVVQTDRSLEYVQIRDERASGFEPSHVLSGYTSQDALHYYEETKDLSTNFYISRIPRGTHVLEYSLTANLVGNYTSGMATIQCLYASEFISHSNSVNVDVSSE